MMSGLQKGLSGEPVSVFYGIFDKLCHISCATSALNLAEDTGCNKGCFAF